MDHEAETLRRLDEVLRVQRAAIRNGGATDGPSRRRRIQAAIDLLVDEYDPLVTAIDEDFGGRTRGYSLMNDVLGSLASLKHARDHVEEWMAPQQRGVYAPYDQLGATAHVRYEPKGTVGILGTWNAPLFTLFSPLAYVLAAGNRAVLKPSEIVPRTAELLARLVAQRFDPADVAAVTGGPAVAEQFTARPFDHIFFTGSTGIGRSVMRGAAQNLVPVTLELGGKSPVLLGRAFDVRLAAERVAIAKAANSGQLCVSPDLVYVPRESLDGFIAALRKEYACLLPTVSGNPDAVGIVNDAHATRIRDAIDDAASRGARIETAPDDPDGADDPADNAQGRGRRMPLHIVVDPPRDATIMEEEIFGPALVVLPYDRIDDAIDNLHAQPAPLALYYFGTDADEQRHVLDSTRSGGVTVNDLMLHPGLETAPFGGCGASGMGHYHGREGFEEFSHARSVFEAPLHDHRREYGLIPPYGDGFEAMLAQNITR